MADIPERVDKLEDKVQEHHQVLFGPEKCPEQGLVSQFSEVKELITKQTVYNRILTFVASGIGLAIIAYVMKMILK